MNLGKYLVSVFLFEVLDSNAQSFAHKKRLNRKACSDISAVSL